MGLQALSTQCQPVSLLEFLPQSYSNSNMKTVYLFTIGVLAVMCSHVESQGQVPPPPPPQDDLLQQFQQGGSGQQSGGTGMGTMAIQRLFPPSRPSFLVWDSRCRVYRRATEQNCPLAFNPFIKFQRSCNDRELAVVSADFVYEIYIYNLLAGRLDGYCRYGHPAVVCPLVNYSCSQFRGSRNLSDEEASESENGRGDEASESENDEDTLEEEWV